MNYYYADAANEVVGPVSEEQLHALHRDGTINHDTHVVPEGSDEWRPYRSATPTIAPPSRALVPATQVQLERIPPPLPVIAATQTCPFCAEQISPAAKKCKHCGETLDVALRAAQEAQRMSARQPAVYMNAGGGGGTTVIVQKRGFPHLLHFFVSVVTAGIWLPIWILLYLFRSRSTYY